MAKREYERGRRGRKVLTATDCEGRLWMVEKDPTHVRPPTRAPPKISGRRSKYGERTVFSYGLHKYQHSMTKKPVKHWFCEQAEEAYFYEK